MRPADPSFDRFGLPSKEQLKRYRIWDSYFTPAHSYPGKDGLSTLIADIERSRRAIEIGQIEKLCYFPHVGIGTTTDPELESLLAANPQVILAPLEKYPDQLIAMLQVNGRNIQATLDAIDYWVKNGPMHGAYFPGGGPGAVACSDRSLEPIIRRLNDLNAVIIQHTWFKTGGKSSDRESTPSELVDVAARFPDQIFIAAHAGGTLSAGRADADGDSITFLDVVCGTPDGADVAYPFMPADGGVVGLAGQVSVHVGATDTAIGDVDHRFPGLGGWGRHLHQLYLSLTGYQSNLHGVFPNCSIVG